MSKNSLDSVLQTLRRVALTGSANDAHLLERFACEGDEAAFERLVLLHGPMVLGLCRRLLRHEQDAEDAFQATFLTLARKARSINKKESLASWLYKVAYRVACRARGGVPALTNRMAMLERANEDGDVDVVCRELRGVLDAEIAALPESYRRPILLCCFQGKTIEEAARLLGCPKATAATWLTRGKERLRRRLRRRGWALSAGALVTVLTDKALAVPLPAGLAGSTLAYVSGKSANAGVLSAKVLALSEGVLRMLWLNKVKMAAGVVLAVVLAGTGVGLVVRQTWADGGEPAISQAEGNEPLPPHRQTDRKANLRDAEHHDSKAEIEALRLENARLRRELALTLKKNKGLKDPPSVKTEPSAQEKEKNSIAALFDGIPADLRSKVQGNPVRGDRLNDWLQKNVDGKEKPVELSMSLRRVRAHRADDGTYVVRLELGDDSVIALGDTWFIVVALANEGEVKTDFDFQKVSSADAENLADLKRITIQGKVREAAATGNVDWQPPYSLLLTLSDVRINGKAFTPFSSAAQEE